MRYLIPSHHRPHISGGEVLDIVQHIVNSASPARGFSNFVERFVLPALEPLPSGAVLAILLPLLLNKRLALDVTHSSASLPRWSSNDQNLSLHDAQKSKDLALSNRWVTYTVAQPPGGLACSSAPHMSQ
jgi:hypothetical protein